MEPEMQVVGQLLAAMQVFCPCWGAGQGVGGNPSISRPSISRIMTANLDACVTECFGGHAECTNLGFLLPTPMESSSIVARRYQRLDATLPREEHASISLAHMTHGSAYSLTPKLSLSLGNELASTFGSSFLCIYAYLGNVSDPPAIAILAVLFFYGQGSTLGVGSNGEQSVILPSPGWLNLHRPS